MENVRQVDQTKTFHIPGARPSNDNRQRTLSAGRSAFPEDAVAHIVKAHRSVTTSGTARARGWRLTFERRHAPFIEPLMGWTGDRDPLAQVELHFPTLQSAIRYARRQGLTYVVHRTPSRKIEAGQVRKRNAAHSSSDAALERLGLSELQENYLQPLAGAADRNDPSGPESWSSAMDVVRDRTLSLEAKRSILMNWAWTEYLIDQAIREGMPESGRPSRLDEVEQALLALERDVAHRQAMTMATSKAA
jgi:hypothetical protein